MDDLQRHATSPPHTETPFEPLSERDLAYIIAQAIADRRNQLGWSQRELAEKVGMKQPHVSRLESANKLPHLDTLLRIANAMGTNLVVKFEEPE
ncbi:helix-turn-helix domain-containing protein [Streptomyces drozdowiczii]